MMSVKFIYFNWKLFIKQIDLMEISKKLPYFQIFYSFTYIKL